MRARGACSASKAMTVGRRPLRRLALSGKGGGILGQGGQGRRHPVTTVARRRVTILVRHRVTSAVLLLLPAMTEAHPPTGAPTVGRAALVAACEAIADMRILLV